LVGFSILVGLGVFISELEVFAQWFVSLFEEDWVPKISVLGLLVLCIRFG